MDAGQSVYSSVAVPLPLSCPFQHLHAWQPYDHDDEIQGQGLSEFKQGQFHVIMMEGVVYRSVPIYFIPLMTTDGQKGRACGVMLSMLV